jgi:hypothetical protein
VSDGSGWNERKKRKERKKRNKRKKRAFASVAEPDDTNVLSPVHRQETIDKRRTGGSPSSRYPAE